LTKDQRLSNRLLLALLYERSRLGLQATTSYVNSAPQHRRQPLSKKLLLFIIRADLCKLTGKNKIKNGMNGECRRVSRTPLQPLQRNQKCTNTMIEIAVLEVAELLTEISKKLR